MNKIVDIFEYAMQMEKEGENYYRRLAQQRANKGLQTILTMLADEEVKHYNAIEKIKIAELHMAETTILTDAKMSLCKSRNPVKVLILTWGKSSFTKRRRISKKKVGIFIWKKPDKSKEIIKRTFSSD